MEYLKIIWKENTFGMSKFSYLELDDERYQKRIVDVFIDDSFGYADEICETNNSFLSEERIPTIGESQDNNKYDANAWKLYEITKEEFDDMWSKAKKYVIEYNIKVNFISNLNKQITHPFRYCGEYFDKESGTIHLSSRYVGG